MPHSTVDTELPPALRRLSWWRRLLQVLLGAALLLQFASWLWIGAALMPWSWHLGLGLLALLLSFRRERVYAACCMVALVAVSWPWWLAAYEARAEALSWIEAEPLVEAAAQDGDAEDTASRPSRLRLLCADCTSWTGGSSELLPVLRDLDADVLVLLIPTDEDLLEALQGLDGYRCRRALIHPPSGDYAGSEHAGHLVLLDRAQRGDLSYLAMPGNPGIAVAATVSSPDGTLSVELLAALLPDLSDPRNLGREQAVRQRLAAELQEHDAATALVLPRSWSVADPRWRSLRDATALRRPRGPMPATWPLWLPTFMGRDDGLIAVRDLGATRLRAQTLPGVAQRGLLVEIAAPARAERPAEEDAAR